MTSPSAPHRAGLTRSKAPPREVLMDPALIPSPHPAVISEDELLKQCSVGKGRSGGPGGQHRNKVETEVTLIHEPTGVSAKAGERRSAVENKRVATRRLRLALATEARSDVPDGDVRSELWRSRVSRGAIRCNERHSDYPAMLAEALDVIYAARLDHKKAALRLECTPSQLIKLIAKHPPAISRLNDDRKARGLHPLKA